MPLCCKSRFLTFCLRSWNSQVYKVEITHDISTWIIYRRYSQFYALLEEVRSYVCLCVSTTVFLRGYNLRNHPQRVLECVFCYLQRTARLSVELKGVFDGHENSTTSLALCLPALDQKLIL